MRAEIFSHIIARATYEFAQEACECATYDISKNSDPEDLFLDGGWDSEELGLTGAREVDAVGISVVDSLLDALPSLRYSFLDALARRVNDVVFSSGPLFERLRGPVHISGGESISESLTYPPYEPNSTVVSYLDFPVIVDPYVEKGTTFSTNTEWITSSDFSLESEGTALMMFNGIFLPDFVFKLPFSTLLSQEADRSEEPQPSDPE